LAFREEKRCTSRVLVGEACWSETSSMTYVDGSIILKFILNRTHLVQVRENVAGFCEKGTEHSGSTK
jgi:hypothetical protein